MRGSAPRGRSLVLTLGCLCALEVLSAGHQTSLRTGTRVPSEGHLRMLAALQKIKDDTPETNVYLGDAQARQGRAYLAGLPASTPDNDRWLVHMRLGEAELRLGNEAEAIDHFTRARQLVGRAGDRATLAPWISSNLFSLGVANLRLGDTQNCLLHGSASRCILPLRGDSLHVEQAPSRSAIAAFTEGLAVAQDPSLKLSMRWLLNIAYMTVGGYPAEVPEALLIPPRFFESEETIPHFTNVAPTLGLDSFDLSGGAVVDDFDNDGYLDIVTSSWDTAGQIHLFRNSQDGTFSERTEEAGLLGLYGGLNIVQADYDNDGHVDLLVLRGAWLAEQGRHPNSLLHNNGDGTFTDVTFEAGLGDVHYPTQTASWADYDNDGDLDLYVGNESSNTLRAPSQLFRNNGNGTFTDVAAAAGVQNDAFAKGVIWGDYDNDRWADLYVSNKGGANRLYRNNGDGTFTDVAPRLSVVGPTESFPVWFWDVNNDGVLDLFVSAYAASIEHLAAAALGTPLDVELARLYRGNGMGGFDDVAGQYNLTRPNAPMGSNFGDLDNDGYLDFYLGTGYPSFHNIMSNVMYRSRKGESFADVSASGGFAHLQKGHAVAFADLDQDGDQDVFEQMGGAYPVDRFTNVLYENPGFGNHWIAIRLVGTRSNRSAIGARLRADIVEDGTRRSIYRHVNSGGSFGANPLRQTLGLGKASRVERLEVFWPTTGATQVFEPVPADRVIQIVEEDASYSTIDLRAATFGR